MIRRILSLVTLVPALLVVCSAQAPEAIWRFAVSGDSRNCGDVVMPAIASSVLAHNVEFYWHLGDFRVGYDVDEDMREQSGGKLTLKEYQKDDTAWDDAIEHQIEPFEHPAGRKGTTVLVGMGNHELYLRGDDEKQSHEDFIKTFRRKWMKETATGYYGWKQQQVDFINLDNSWDDGFREEQLSWLEQRLQADKSDPNVLTVVIGMHRALPNSLACGHSMNGDSYSSPEANQKSLDSGRKAYQYLWTFQNTTLKHVYVLASHSHFYMENIFDTPYWNNRTLYWDAKNDGHEGSATALKGWLIGTAGAVRYRLPENLPPKTLAITYAYGYLLGTVRPDGTIALEFKQVTEADVPPEIMRRHKDFVNFCFLANRDDTPHAPEKSCNDQ